MYYVYLLRCSDGSLYCGIAADPQKRVRQHNTNQKKAAKYTWSRRPVLLVYTEAVKSRSEALKREYTIKRMSKKKKELIITVSSPRTDY